MSNDKPDTPDTYEVMREALDQLMKEQDFASGMLQKLLSSESSLFRQSLEAQSLKSGLRNWLHQQAQINERVGQLLTILDNRIKD